MNPDTITEGLESLKKANLYRTPSDLYEIGEFWLQKFELMPEDQFKYAVNAIINNESTWPAIATIYRYASIWTESGRKEKACPYCSDTGLLLIKTKNKHVAYACCCEIGRGRQKNLKIPPFEKLGIPWDEVDSGEVSYNRKISAELRQKLDGFLEGIGGEMVEGDSG